MPPIKISRDELTEIGKRCYDLIMSFNPPNDDFVCLMLCLAKGDDNKLILIDFLKNECQNIRHLHDYVIERWG